MAVTGATMADIAVLIAGQDFRIYHIERDEALIKTLVERVRSFWYDNVIADVAPDPTNAHDIAQLYPHNDGGALLADADSEATIIELKTIKESIKYLAEQKEALENKIKRALGNNAVLVNEENKPLATWNNQKSRRVDVKMLREDLPEIAENYTKSSDSRVLRIK